jgi:glycerol uptake facilitator-like aquaporin
MVSQHFQSLWLYLVAPVMGAVTAVGVHKILK